MIGAASTANSLASRFTDNFTGTPEHRYKMNRVSLIMLFLAAAACSPEAPRSSFRAPSADLGDFGSATVLVDSIVLGSQDTARPVRYSALQFRPRGGGYAIVDVSEGHALYYDVRGRLERIVGRKGRGPGELEEPRMIAFDSRGRAYIGEGNGRVSLFSETGEYVRSFAIKALGISSLSVWGDSLLVATTFSNPSGVLLVADTLGDLKHRFLPRGRAPVASDPDNPRWLSVLQYWQVIFGDSARVFATISDSMWSVDLRSGGIAATRLSIPAYNAPAMSAEVSGNRTRMFSWMSGRSVAMGQWAAPGRFGISFVRGILAYGDTSVLMIRSREGNWTAIRNARAVFAGTDSLLLGLLAPTSDTATLGTWRIVR